MPTCMKGGGGTYGTTTWGGAPMGCGYWFSSSRPSTAFSRALRRKLFVVRPSRNDARLALEQALSCVATNIGDWIDGHIAGASWAGNGLVLKRSDADTSEALLRAVDALVFGGFLRKLPGTGQRGVASTYIPTDEAFALWDSVDFSVDAAEPVPEPETWAKIAVTEDETPEQTRARKERGAAKNRIYLENDERLLDLERFNRHNGRFEWYMRWPGYAHHGRRVGDRDWARLFTEAIVHTRTFSRGSLDLGGRFYVDVVNFERPHRLHIEVARPGEAPQHLGECDFAAMHPQMAYDLSGAVPRLGRRSDGKQEDLYDCGDESIPRELRKVLLNLLLNARSADGVVGAVNGWWHPKKRRWVPGAWEKELDKQGRIEAYLKARGLPVEKPVASLPAKWPAALIHRTVEALAERHAPIRDFFFSDAGVRLQRLDSTIAEIIAEHFIERGLPLLILHDGFLTVESALPELRDVMVRAYGLVVGTRRPIAVKAKTRDGDVVLP
jgi:hypothetical protein